MKISITWILLLISSSRNGQMVLFGWWFCAFGFLPLFHEWFSAIKGMCLWFQNGFTTKFWSEFRFGKKLEPKCFQWKRLIFSSRKIEGKCRNKVAGWEDVLGVQYFQISFWDNMQVFIKMIKVYWDALNLYSWEDIALCHFIIQNVIFSAGT